jgi:hypothetical protein
MAIGPEFQEAPKYGLKMVLTYLHFRILEFLLNKNHFPRKSEVQGPPGA